MSKCLEKVIAQQLIEHTSDMTELYQSAYKSTHSTETALIAVCDDIKRGFDNRKGSVLVMIDLSAIFDTINHSILLQRLRNRYGITHSAFIMVSVLSSRKMPMRIYIGSLFSKVKIATRQSIGPPAALIICTTYWRYY